MQKSIFSCKINATGEHKATIIRVISQSRLNSNLEMRRVSQREIINKSPGATWPWGRGVVKG